MTVVGLLACFKTHSKELAEPNPKPSTSELQTTPVATPCRAPANRTQRPTPSSYIPSSSSITPTEAEPTPKSHVPDVPDIDDETAPKPAPQVLRISEAAADARLRRVFKPSARTGEFKVSQEIIKQYRRAGKGRKALMKIFETCGYDQEHLPVLCLLISFFSRPASSFQSALLQEAFVEEVG